MPLPLAASRYQLERQLRQKPARFIRSMFCTSVRSRRCSTRRRKAAASKSRCWVSVRSAMATILPVVACRNSGRKTGATFPGIALDRPGARAVLPDLMYIVAPVDSVNDRRKPGRPIVGAALVGDQVLPDLDQGVGETVDDGVAEHGVAAERPVIGLVVA